VDNNSWTLRTIPPKLHTNQGVFSDGKMFADDSANPKPSFDRIENANDIKL